MCRIFGCVAREPVDIAHDLLRAENPLVRQSEQHDSGWGMAVYERPDGGEPRLVRFPHAAHADRSFAAATELRGRIFNVHVRRATMGGLTLANTHPFTLAGYSFGHNGTILRFPRLLARDATPPHGDTDSEALFQRLMSEFDPGDVPGSLRRAVLAGIASGPFSGLNFLFSDGERLYAYNLGVFELHWTARRDRLLVASERMGDGPWHDLGQDVLLTLDPEDTDEPHAERLVGDRAVEAAEIVHEQNRELRGEERGAFAARRAERLAAARG